MTRALLLLVALTIATLSGGCASYATPGRGAEMALFGATHGQRENLTDSAIRTQLDRKPLARFPTALAIARVQAPEYHGRHHTTHGRGRYTVITSRDAENESHLKRLANLPLVIGVAPINRLLLPDDLQSDRELRSAAAALHADITLVYTIDTTFRIGDMGSPLDVVTLGFLPSRRAYVATTASAVLLDTRNGYVYGVAEATATNDQPANTWTSEKAVDDCRIKTESQAMAKLIDEVERTWTAMIKTQSTQGAKYFTQ